MRTGPTPWLLWVALACSWLPACGGATPEARRPAPIDVGAGTADPANAAKAEATVRSLPVAPAFDATETRALDDLVARLHDAVAEETSILLAELAERFGGRGLVRALERGVPEDPPEKRWFRTEQILGALEHLADPSAADHLAAYITQTRDEHTRGRAAALLAQLGDLRAAAPLARRLRHSPQELYDPQRFWEAGPAGHLSRTDSLRIEAVRLLADLAQLHPERRADLVDAAEGAVIEWVTELPYPHANAMRFLARVRSDRGRPLLRQWAFPPGDLPAEGASPPFPAEIEIAMSALRYVGAARDVEMLSQIEAQLLRKDAGRDYTMEAMVAGRFAMRGMAIRALGVGAARGLSELGAPAASSSLDLVIRDPLHNLDVRDEACNALAWTVPVADVPRLVEDFAKNASPGDPISAYRAECALGALSRRALPAAAPSLVALLTRGGEPTRLAAAALLSTAGAGDAEPALIALLEDQEARPYAVAALLLGGAESAARTAGKPEYHDDRTSDALGAVLRTVRFVSGAHLEQGTLWRWGRNLAAVGVPPWAEEPLHGFLESVAFDLGPHSVSRVVLRRRIVEHAAFGDAAALMEARALLTVMKEPGALHYLARVLPQPAGGGGAHSATPPTSSHPMPESAQSTRMICGGDTCSSHWMIVVALQNPEVGTFRHGSLRASEMSAWVPGVPSMANAEPTGSKSANTPLIGWVGSAM